MSAGDNHVESAELKLLIERWERLQGEKKGITEDQADVMREAKSRGYDTKMMRQVIKLRAMEGVEREQHEELRETYKAAMGLA